MFTITIVCSLFAATRALDSCVLKFALVSVIQLHLGRINLHACSCILYTYIHIVLAGVCRFVGAAGTIDTCEHKSKCRSTLTAQNHQGSFIKYEWKFNSSLVIYGPTNNNTNYNRRFYKFYQMFCWTTSSKSLLQVWVSLCASISVSLSLSLSLCVCLSFCMCVWQCSWVCIGAGVLPSMVHLCKHENTTLVNRNLVVLLMLAQVQPNLVKLKQLAVVLLEPLLIVCEDHFTGVCVFFCGDIHYKHIHMSRHPKHSSLFFTHTHTYVPIMTKTHFTD